MRKSGILFSFLFSVCAFTAVGQEGYDTDVIPTSKGDLKITFLGHGTVMLAFGGKIIHVDPYGKVADYGKLPKADLILITHEHQDHLDPASLGKIRTDATKLITTESVARQLTGSIVMKNGDSREVDGLRIEAVAAYNIVHKRDNGQAFHPPGIGNGYIITFGDVRLYLAGDTENTPEMKALADISVAFLPMNLPYTMTPEMVADAARAFRPKILYPYHFSGTDPQRLVDLLESEKNIDVRVRAME